MNEKTKSRIKLAYDILMVRRYKKQIFLANIAGVGVLIGYYAFQERREDKQFKRLVAKVEHLNR